MDAKNCFDGHVPAEIKAFSIWFCRAANINGLADPMYIANVVGVETGAGDGQSHFVDADHHVLGHDDAQLVRLAERLFASYWACATTSGVTAQDIFNKLRAVAAGNLADVQLH